MLLANMILNFFMVPIEEPGGDAVGAPSPFVDVGVLFSNLVSAGIIVTALASFAFLLLGGFQYITSGGDKAQVEASRHRLTYAVLGLVVVAGAAAIFSVLGPVLGIHIFGTIVWPTPGP